MSKAKKGNSGSVGANNKPRKSKKQDQDKFEDVDDLIDQMEKLEPRARQGAMVGANELIDKYGKEKTQEIIRQGLRSQKIAVHAYDYQGSGVSADQKKKLLEFDGKYFNGVSVRQ